MTRLAGADLKAFEAYRDRVENRLIALRRDRIMGALRRGTRC